MRVNIQNSPSSSLATPLHSSVSPLVPIHGGKIINFHTFIQVLNNIAAFLDID